ncbi:MAG: hypothetical protein HY040_17215 [Planctomycetes bacterium]|nr:hypothetical protein [Planctomycetota bacterium]
MPIRFTKPVRDGDACVLQNGAFEFKGEVVPSVTDLTLYLLNSGSSRNCGTVQIDDSHTWSIRVNQIAPNHGYTLRAVGTLGVTAVDALLFDILIA